MTLSIDHPPRRPILEALFAHEVLRRLGIQADDIYLAVNSRGNSLDTLVVAVVVRKDGREWAWLIADVEAPLGLALEAEALAREWMEAVKFWNNGPRDIGDRWGYLTSRAVNAGMAVMVSLQAKGITIDPTSDIEALNGRNN